jgi:very-short-patch-repair endonuclease
MNNRKKNNGELIDLRRSLRKTSTDAERIVWSIVRNKKIKGCKFFRQYSIGKYILDFYCPKMKLCVEIDGGQHNEPEKIQDDLKRTNYLKQQGIRVLRFWNNDVLTNINGVYQKINGFITPPNLPLS